MKSTPPWLRQQQEWSLAKKNKKISWDLSWADHHSTTLADQAICTGCAEDSIARSGIGPEFCHFSAIRGSTLTGGLISIDPSP
ncbi:MAG: hypothetical protein M1608_04405 [Candidatus Omnitrophica bacterium]|nr:hypothetical protein [Candidatus Omnitrophota bacterium]